MVSRPTCLSSVSSTFSSVPMIRAPVIPKGWPRAIAPPWVLSLSSSIPHSAMIGITWAAKASFSSTRSTSEIDIPARSRTFLIAPIGATPISSGSLPWVAAVMIRARGVRPSSLALASLISSTAAAPSFSGQELPAVTPPPPKASGSSASFSRVEEARGPSSFDTTVPSARVTGTISRSKKPSSCDLTASSCERWANLSMSSRETPYLLATLTAVNVANKYGVSREDIDKFAQRSQELAVKSQEDGFFDREIVPVTLADGTVVSKDDGPRASSTLEKLAELPEAFGGGGVTAGNSCPLNDGAAAVLLMSDTKAKELGLTPRARIVTAATYGNEPELMGVAPIGAVKKVLDRAGMSIGDVDRVELNEAFAAQVIPIMAECGIEEDKLNTHGGAIALGHPFGMTGARIMGTLLNVLETDDQQVGLETMCVAGGQGKAMLVERV